MIILLTITKLNHILILNQSQTLPHACLHYLTEEFNVLSGALNHEIQVSFSLEEHGHQMVVLESSDNFHCLPIISPNNSQLDLLKSMPEYVELNQLPDGFSMYRICFMFDNESCLLVFILNDTLEPKLEQWLLEQSEAIVR
jgi:hypothetical protein